MSEREIHIAAALLLADDGRTLLVRKRGTRAFMQPGGKIEPGEQPAQALARELFEELGLRIDPSAARFLATLGAAAANEPGYRVRCELFEVRASVSVTPAAEIEEARWVGPQAAQALELAPLTGDLVLPRYFY